MVSNCTCNGLKILEELTDFYTEKATTFIEKKEERKIWYKKTKYLADRLYNQLTIPEIESPNSIVNDIKRSSTINSYKRACEENLGSDCVFYLDNIAARIHHDTRVIHKLICTKGSEEEESMFLDDRVYELMTDLLTSEHIDQKEGKVLYNPFEVRMPSGIIDKCKKSKK